MEEQLLNYVIAYGILSYFMLLLFFGIKGIIIKDYPPTLLGPFVKLVGPISNYLSFINPNKDEIHRKNYFTLSLFSIFLGIIPAFMFFLFILPEQYKGLEALIFLIFALIVASSIIIKFHLKKNKGDIFK